VRYQRDLQSSSLVSLRLTCSEARIGISPMTLRNSCIACLISAKRQRRACTHGETSDAPVAPSQYSPTIHGTPEHLARLDLAKGRDELLGDGRSKRGELLDHLAMQCISDIQEICHPLDPPDEGYNVHRRRVVGVAEEVHEDVDHVRGDLRELDGARVNALDKELAVLEVLKDPSATMGAAVETCAPCRTRTPSCSAAVS
jgi:hypothetical protein